MIFTIKIYFYLKSQFKIRLRVIIAISKSLLLNNINLQNNNNVNKTTELPPRYHLKPHEICSCITSDVYIYFG